MIIHFFIHFVRWTIVTRTQVARLASREGQVLTWCQLASCPLQSDGSTETAQETGDIRVKNAFGAFESPFLSKTMTQIDLTYFYLLDDGTFLTALIFVSRYHLRYPPENVMDISWVLLAAPSSSKLALCMNITNEGCTITQPNQTGKGFNFSEHHANNCLKNLKTMDSQCINNDSTTWNSPRLPSHHHGNSGDRSDSYRCRDGGHNPGIKTNMEWSSLTLETILKFSVQFIWNDHVINDHVPSKFDHFWHSSNLQFEICWSTDPFRDIAMCTNPLKYSEIRSARTSAIWGVVGLTNCVWNRKLYHYYRSF